MNPPRSDEGAAATAPLVCESSDSNLLQMVQPSRHRRNAHRAAAATNGAALAAVGSGSVGAPEAARAPLGGAGELLLAPGTTARDAWIAWLSPLFAGTQSCYFTGTYSDDYGLPNGLMLARNVHKDFRRFLDSFGYEGRFINGVEHHQYRDVLHLHAILEGPFTDEQMRWVKRWWASERGHARALPVLDGCASYVTKYALKGDTESFDWRLS